jgi:hypothetical protein
MTHGTGVLATIVAPHAALASACVRVLVLLLPPPPLAIRLRRGAS